METKKYQELIEKLQKTLRELDECIVKTNKILKS